MSKALWQYSARHTYRRAARSLLTLCGISIGVATIVAVSIAVQTMRGVYDEMFDAVTGRAAIEVTAAAHVPFDPSLASRLADLDSVDAAVSVIQRPAALLSESGSVPVLILGIDPDQDQAVREYELLEGTFLQENDGVLVGVDLAKSHQLQVGSQLRLATTAGILEFPLAGVLKPKGAARYNGGLILFAPLGVVQAKFGMNSNVNAVHLVVSPHKSENDALAEVDRVLPKGFTAQSSSQAGQLARAAVLNLEQILAVLGVVSLVTGGFVILNTFQINLGERRRQLAILRAIGATPGQITAALMREAAVYGALGTVLGIGLGFVIAVGLLPGIEGAVGTGVSGLRLTAEPFLLAIVMGPGMTLAAVYVPSRRASRRRLLGDLLQTPTTDADKTLRLLPTLLGFVLIAICIGIVSSFILGWISVQLGSAMLPAAIMFGLVGCVLILPLALVPLTQLVGKLLCSVFGVEGQLAWRQMTRDQGRTTLTCGVLVVAVIIAIGPGNEITSGMNNMYQWLDNVGSSDFIIDAAAPDVGFITAVNMPENIGSELSRIADVDRVDQVNWFPVQVEGTTALMIASTYSVEHPQRLNPSRNTPPDAIERLIDGEAVLGTVLAQRLDLNIGDEFEITSTKQTTRFRIAGLSSQYHAGGMTVHLHRDVAQQVFDLEGVHLFAVDAARGRVSAVARRLDRYCKEKGLRMQSFAQLKSDIEERISGTSNFLWVMMALVFLVAALGIINTLTMNVLEQTRELGILRAIGMTRSQVGKTVVAQGLGTVLISLPPGLFLGVCLALLTNLAQEPLTGHYVPFRLHAFLLVGTVAAAMLTTMAATWLPAQRAAYTQIVKAIQYE